MSKIDAVTFEVIRHKLWSIGDEQTITLKSVSGSPVVTESSDFNNGIYLSDGSIVMFGRQVLAHAGTMSQVLKNTMKECEEDPKIEEDDMFVANDPYKGAVHVPDVSIMAPFFHNGERVAWFGCCAHQLDMGGMDFGSWCPKATERYQEGLIISPIKLVQRGKLREDILKMILSNSRLPFLVELDIRAMIASNNIAKRSFLDIITRYGWDSVREVMESLLNISERKLRDRLMELPDGKYRAVDYLDHDGLENKLYKVALTLTKDKDSLLLDFSGTSRQAPSFINCAESAMWGGILWALLPLLAFDIPWNSGLNRAIKIIAPKGSLCNAELPAPVGSGPTAAVWVVQNVVSSALSRLLACSEKYREESEALNYGGWPTLNLRGMNQYGELFGTMILDGTGGAGAYFSKDGLDVRKHGMLAGNIANVEANENFAPLLYLYRRMLKDSAGAGEYRGGRSISLAFSVHDTSNIEGLLVSHGVEVPNASGVFGGYPGACNKNTIIKDSDIEERRKEGNLPLDGTNLKGEKVDLGAKPGRFALKKGDVLEYNLQGGGGTGSPLERPPLLVFRDVKYGIVSENCAREIYGVEIDNEKQEIDFGQTSRLRNKKRSEMAESDKSASKEKSKNQSNILQIGRYMQVIEKGDGKFMVCRCGYSFGDLRTNWKEGARMTIITERMAGPLVKLHKDLKMRRYSCPDCGLLHCIEVGLKGEEPLWDIELKL